MFCSHCFQIVPVWLKPFLAQDGPFVFAACLLAHFAIVAWMLAWNSGTLPALEIALQFLRVIAKEATNRHVAAAMASALFNVVVKYHPSDQGPSEHPSVATARELHQLLADHADTNVTTLAQALSAFKDILPPDLHKRIVAVNRAASYHRHQVVKDVNLLAQVHSFLASFSRSRNF